MATTREAESAEPEGVQQCGHTQCQIRPCCNRVARVATCYPSPHRTCSAACEAESARRGALAAAPECRGSVYWSEGQQVDVGERKAPCEQDET
jgi:hypothetical protein